ncbi:hypothetical protein KJ570_00995 [Patescibacteria group bacterium]|nr:hypothetical protein [Patescibacteria group bacterium]MBU2036557.1 hypothetical protein [Patescibacteria group bacterium]
MKINYLKNIPILGIPDRPVVSSTWKYLPISDICEDIVLYKDGGAGLIMESSSLNFSLLSQREQEAVVASYAALINSLSFSIQILVRSQKKDITNYLKYLDQIHPQQKNQKLSILMQSYKNFILNSVKKKNVLGKKFYIVIPFSPLELGVGKSIKSTLKGGGHLPFPKSYVVKKAKIILYPKRDHLIRQAGRLGIKLKQLTNYELISLLYSIFNPQAPVIKQEKTAEEISGEVKINTK